MIKISDISLVGKFQRTHALKGELNMIIDIDPDYFLEGNPMIVDYDGIYVPYYVESLRPKGSTSYLVKLAGINSEKEASSFVNKDIYIEKEDALQFKEELSESPHYLIGFNVFDINQGKAIGIIDDLLDIKSNLILCINTNDNEELLIPFNKDFIKEIDDIQKTLKMDLPDGLIDINKKNKG